MGFEWKVYLKKGMVDTWNSWNSLPEEVVEIYVMIMFKRQIDKHLNSHGIGGYRLSLARLALCR